jgi:hypothetical protein
MSDANFIKPIRAMRNKKLGRDITIDIAKGLATMIMTFAHCAALVLNSHQQQQKSWSYVHS